jgi:hypothetical protein
MLTIGNYDVLHPRIRMLESLGFLRKLQLVVKMQTNAGESMQNITKNIYRSISGQWLICCNQMPQRESA